MGPRGKRFSRPSLIELEGFGWGGAILPTWDNIIFEAHITFHRRHHETLSCTAPGARPDGRLFLCSECNSCDPLYTHGHIFPDSPTATFTPSPLPPTDTPEATPTPNAFHFRLPARGCWMNSEISVRAGQTVVTRASGETSTWDGREGSSGNPNGQTGLCGAIQCLLQSVGYGALIGRLEDLPPFFVGTTLRFNAAKDGQLYFTVNDWQCDDNRGVFDILITFP